MPYKESEVEKLYYSISEVSEMFGENTSLIRFWSTKFEGIVNPHKNKRGVRMYTKQDLETLKIIYHLVKEKGMTLEGAAKRIIDNRDGEARNLEIIRSLEEIKNILLEVKDLL